MTDNPTPNEIALLREALKPCPFCGGEAERYTSAIGVGFENRQVQCRQCGASAFDRKWQCRAALAPGQHDGSDEQESANPRCGCKPEVARRVIVEHGTCAMGGCPYGGDV